MNFVRLNNNQKLSINNPIIYTIIFQLIFTQYLVGSEPEIKSQENNDILPPSPTAYSLGKYGDVPVGMHTGAAQFNIPIYNFKTRNLELPISLNYSSNGVKVDQIASWVGLGWSLNAGGVITRTVMDEPDEWTSMIPPDDMSELNPLAAEYVERAAREGFDNQPDNFNYNFPGFTGKFVFDRKQQRFAQIPNENLYIDSYVEESKAGFIIITPDGVKYYFLDAETSRNFQYGENCGKTFDIHTETAWYLTRIEHPSGDTIKFYYKDNTYTYLTGVHQTLTRPINTVWNPSGEGGCSQSPIDTKCYKELQVKGKTLDYIENESFGKIDFLSSKTRNDLNDYQLNEIRVFNTFDNINPKKKFLFEYIESDHANSDFKNPDVLDEEVNHRLFLKTFKEEGKEPYTFSYEDINALPPRLSFSQDYWGYFNGKSNTYFVPSPPEGLKDIFPGNLKTDRDPNSAYAAKGILKQITYPTKAISTIHYEANKFINTVVGESESITQHKSLFITSLDEGGLNDNSDVIIVNKDQTVDFTYQLRFCDYADKCEIGTGRMEGTIELRDNADEIVYSNSLDFHITDIAIIDGQPTSKELQFSAPLNKEEFYSLRITARGLNIKSYVSYDIKIESQDLVVGKEYELGGLRVQKITNSLGTNTKRYFYNTYLKRDNANPIFMENKLFYERIHYKLCNTGLACSSVDCYQLKLHSSSLHSIYNTSGQSVYYPYVTVSDGENFENGGTQYHFVAEKDGSNYVIWGTDFLHGSPRLNLSWDNGRKLEEISFKVRNGQMVKLKKIKYEYEEKIVDVVKGYVIQKNYDPCCSGEIVTQCTEDLKNESFTYQYCSTDHQHWYKVGGNCLLPDAKIETVTIKHPCASGSDYVIDHHANEVYSVVGYDIFSIWKPLTKITTYTFDTNGDSLVGNTENFYYENYNHAQITKKQFANSQGRKITTKYKYPLDYGQNYELLEGSSDEMTKCIAYMVSNNIVSKPIEIYKKIDDVVEGASINSYRLQDNKVFPYETYMLEIKEPVNESELQQTNTFTPSKINNNLVFEIDNLYGNTPENKLIYNDYGNIIETSMKNDIPTSYLWGYNNTLPIAKIVGLSYEEVKKKVSPDDIQEKTGEELSTMLAPLRDLDAMVTIYTYDPLIGMTSMTDENGLTTYYEYDDFGRLKCTRDDGGNIINTYKYHYAGEEN